MEDGLEVQGSSLPEHNPQAIHKESINNRRMQDTRGVDGLYAYGVEKRDQQRARYPLWVVIATAIVTAVVVGAAVGGGVGSKLHNDQKGTQNCSQETATRTITKTSPTILNSPSAATTSGGELLNYIPKLPSSIFNVDLDCPTLNEEVYTTDNSGQTFQISCNTAFIGGDIASLVAYTLQDCIEACGSVNYYTSLNGYTGNTSNCTRIEFHAIMGASNTQSNCWIKTNGAQTPLQTAGSLESRNLAASASMISS